MNKKNKILLAQYKKSNKERRKKLLELAGFSTEEEYMQHLGLKVKSTVAKTVKNKTVSKIVPNATNEPTDYVIAFDTTGSMSAYIESVKKRVVQLVGELFTNIPDLRLKIVAFGDYCDMDSKTKFGEAYQEIELTNDQRKLVNFVNNVQDTSGGDSDEFYELVIRKINRETKWRPSAKKHVLLIADDVPHSLGYTLHPYVKNNQISWREEANEARDLGIQYDTLKIIPRNTWYNELSKITGGVCMDFKNSKNISKVIEGSTYVRANKAVFMMRMEEAEASGDKELIGAYKTMSSLL